MMECPGLFSRGDLGPFHCHCLVHSQNYKVYVGGGLCVTLLWQNWIGVGVTDELPHHWMPGLLCSTPNQRLEISQRCPHLGIYRRKWGKTTKLLFLCSFPLFLLLLYVSFILLCCFCFCVGSQIQFVVALMDFLPLYLVPTLSFWSLGTVSGRSWSGVMSTSGRLSRWSRTLAALLIGLGFNSQSSEGCLGLRSPTLHHLVLPLTWFSTIADQGDISLTTL